MAVSAGALTSLARVKARLPNVAAGHDSLLEDLIDSCSAFVERVCRRRFLRTTYTNELYDGYDETQSRKTTVLLRNYPVVSVSSVGERLTRLPSETWQTIAIDQYDVDLSNGLLLFDGALSAGFRNIRVTYTAGYLIDFTQDTDPAYHNLPADLTLATEKMVVREFHRRDHAGESSRGVGSDQIVWQADLDSDIQRIMVSYVRTEF